MWPQGQEKLQAQEAAGAEPQTLCQPELLPSYAWEEKPWRGGLQRTVLELGSQCSGLCRGRYLWGGQAWHRAGRVQMEGQLPRETESFAGPHHPNPPCPIAPVALSLVFDGVLSILVESHC